jgi:glycosyltransferase involved in cell wall biosynthesis
MHIGLFSPAWPVNEFSNGIVTYVHILRAELMTQGHQVSVFTNVIGRSSKDARIHLVEPNWRCRVARNLSAIFRHSAHADFNWGKSIAAAVRKVHKTEPLDIFEMEESFGWCADVQRSLPFPVVVKLHGPAFLDLVDEERKTKFAQEKMAAEGRALLRAVAIIAPSQSTLRNTTSRYGIKSPILKTVPNPLSLDAELGIWSLQKCDQKTILFVGRFDRRKGGDTVLLAFQKLLTRYRSLKLIFVGPDIGLVSADGSPRIHFEEFRNTLFDESQRSSIVYLGKLPRSEIFQLRTKAFLTVAASRWENQNYTALEAMAQGCPIVVSNADGLRELVEHEVTGLVAELDDSEDLCRKISNLLDNPSKAQLLGENARKVATNNYSASKLAQDTIQVYRDAISIAETGIARP